MGAIGQIAGGAAQGIGGAMGGNPMDMIKGLMEQGIKGPEKLMQMLMQMMQQGKGGECGGGGC